MPNAMIKAARWARQALGIKPPLYVIIYDMLNDAGDPETEEYYGYFGSPEEARRVWRVFIGDRDSDRTIGNVMLCRVVDQDWQA